MASPAQMDRNRMGLNFSNRPRSSSSAKKGAFSYSPPSSAKKGAFAYTPTKSSVNLDEVISNANNSINDNNSGIDAFNFNPNQSSGSGMNVATNLAQQVLGSSYPQALALGYDPSELMDMVTKAQGYGQGINVDKFKTDLDRYEGFLDADVPGGGVFKFDDPQDDGTTITKQYVNVTRPEVTANPPEGVMGLLGAMFSPFADLAEAGADFALGGGALGRVLGGLKDTYMQGKNFMGDVFNPGNLTQRILSLTPEQQRVYYQLLPNMTYQQAFEQASGQAFARGGISSLN